MIRLILTLLVPSLIIIYAPGLAAAIASIAAVIFISSLLLKF